MAVGTFRLNFLDIVETYSSYNASNGARVILSIG